MNVRHSIIDHDKEDDLLITSLYTELSLHTADPSDDIYFDEGIKSVCTPLICVSSAGRLYR
jgi:hypothetical protein